MSESAVLTDTPAAFQTPDTPPDTDQEDNTPPPPHSQS